MLKRSIFLTGNRVGKVVCMATRHVKFKDFLDNELHHYKSIRAVIVQLAKIFIMLCVLATLVILLGV